MNRRHAVRALLVGSSCLWAATLVATAKPVEKVFRIGVLGVSTAAEAAANMRVFRQTLRELGWVAERAIVFEERYADGNFERLPQLAAELVALKVDLILVDSGTPGVRAAMKATRHVPIVFSSVGDPVGQKMVQSLAHPGGNVTGFSIMAAELTIKKTTLLIEAVPGLKRIAFLVNSANPATAYFAPVIQAAIQSRGIQLEVFDIREFETVEKAFERMSRAGAQAVRLQDDYAFSANLKQIGMLALKYRLPMMAGDDEMGVLLTYGRDSPALFRQVATQVDKILKGANPGDLPIEQPTKFRLVINLKTAKAIGVTIPQSLLLRADEVIE
jgi:putative tryptophan/tyrosine transport system substrate-binding protein